MGLMDWIKAADYGVALPTISKLPRALAYRLADLRGRMLTYSRRDSFTWASRNVESVFPDFDASERRRVVIGHYQVESRDAMEAFWYSKPLSHLQSFVRCTGLDTLQEAASSGDGVLLFSSHMGSTGLFLVFAGKSGVPMDIVARSIEPEDNPLHPVLLRYSRKRVRWIETAIGRPLLITGRGNYSRLVEKLRAGGVVMMLIDVLPTLVNPKYTTEVTFFGRRAWFPNGIASLFFATGSRLFHWTIHRSQATGFQEIEISEVTDSFRPTADRAQFMQELVRMLEQDIRRYPDHWLSWDSLGHYFRRPEG